MNIENLFDFEEGVRLRNAAHSPEPSLVDGFLLGMSKAYQKWFEVTGGMVDKYPVLHQFLHDCGFLIYHYGDINHYSVVFKEGVRFSIGQDHIVVDCAGPKSWHSSFEKDYFMDVLKKGEL